MSRTNRILVVDDDAAVRGGFVRILQAGGYEVSEAATGLQALQLVREQRPDVVLLDVRLPDLSGLEVCRQIKGDPNLQDVFVALCSGQATSTRNTVDGLAAGADEYVTKPVNPEELLERIRTLERLRDSIAGLRASEQHFRRLVDILPDAVCLIDPQGRLLSINPQGMAMLGYDASTDMLPTSLFDLTPGEDHARVRAHLTTALEAGILRNVDCTLLRRNGDRFPAEWSAGMSPGGNGQPAALVSVLRDITDRKQAESLLKQREEFSRKIIGTAMEAFWMADLSGKLLDVNDTYCRMAGYSRQELLSMHISDLEVNEPARQLVDQHIQRITQTGGDRFETRHRCKDGRVIEVEVVATFVASRGGCICAFMRDNTERKRAEETLRASEERFRQLAENIREVFWLSDPDKNEVIYVSPAYEEIWGRSCESLYASPQKWIKAVHPDDRERVLEAMLTKQTAGQYDEVYRIVRPNGAVRWIQDRAFPVRDESGRVYRVVGIADDITARRLTEQAYRESEARKSAIMQGAMDGIITIDHAGRIVELNAAVEKLFGQSHAKLIGGRIVEMISLPRLRAWFRAGLASGFAGDRGPTFGTRVEVPALRADGSSFFAEFTITPVKLMGPPLFTVYIRDITRRKRTDEELRHIPRQIIEAQEVERLRVARELHDGVNQLIASVKMRIRKVEAGLAGVSPAAQEILSRCNRLLVQALEENRRIAHNLHPSDLDNLGLADACRNLCRDLQSRTNLKVRCRISQVPERLPLALELNLFRIIQEAVNNVEKHARAKSLHVTLGFQKGSVSLKIQDDGHGFSVGQSRRSGRKGHGLGLTNMRERTMGVGGTFEVTSVLKKGTLITVRVPRIPVR